MIRLPIIVAQFFKNVERATFPCGSSEEAREIIDNGNKLSGANWRWGLSRMNFVDDEGVPLTIAEANEIRVACGIDPY